jgi:hypothetical protein
MRQPPDHHGVGRACSSSAPSCWCRCCPRASFRPTTTRKPRSTWSCPGLHAWRKPSQCRGTRADPASRTRTSSVYTTIGGGQCGLGPVCRGRALSEVRKATLTIQLTPRGELARASRAIETDMRERLAELPGVRTRVGLGGSGEKYMLVLTGEDPNALREPPPWPLSATCAPSRPGQLLLLRASLGAARDRGAP